MANGGELTPAANLVDWRLGLEELRHPFAEQLRENADPYAVAASLSLPVPEYVKFPSPANLLANPTAGLLPLVRRGITNYYVGLRPMSEGLPKYRNEAPLTVDAVVPYITERIAPEDQDKYVLRVAEYVVAVCGTVIVINPSGSEHIDMVMGDLGPLATGRVSPEFQSHTDRFTGARRYYDFGQEHADAPPLQDHHPIVTREIRAAIAAGLRHIPKLGPGMRDPRIPGRYEMALVNHFNYLDPVFVDAQPDGPHHHPYALPEEPLF